MANLNIEKKDRPIWPWIALGIVLLAALAWFLMARDDTPRTDTGDAASSVIADTSLRAAAQANDPSAATIEGAPEEVNDYLRYTAEHRAQADADLSHEYTANGIRRLASALGAITDRDTVGGTNVPSLVADLRDRADALERNQESMSHARYAKDAFISAGDLMQALQQRSYPNAGAEVEQARQAAQSVDTDGPLLAQRTRVQAFFDHSARVVQAMMAHGTS
ncbi:MAG: hypothetical protein ACR2HZ_08260 [Gemmatimonadaceae bacterium]